MRGSIVKRCGDDRRTWSRCPHSWSVIVSLGRDENGKQRQVWRTVRGSRDAAEKELTRLLHEHDAGRLGPPSKITLEDYLAERWIPHMRTRIRPTTLKRYEVLLREHVVPVIGKVELSRLRPVDVQRVVDRMVSRGLAPRSTIQGYRVLSGALRQAMRWQMIPSNPAQAVQPPRTSRPELVIPDPETLSKIIDHTKGTPGYLPILIVATTGMRRGEVAGLRWRDVDLGRGVLSITSTLQRVGPDLVFMDPKTPSARRTVAIPPAVVDVLKTHRKEQTERRLLLGAAWQDLDLVVDRGDGAPYDPDSYTHWLRDAAKAVGAPGVRFHDLRHGFATALLVQGVHPKVVSEALGHSNVGFTLQVYSHVLPSMGDQAAEAIGRALALD